jgi:hypothetical protein
LPLCPISNQTHFQIVYYTERLSESLHAILDELANRHVHRGLSR